VATKRLCPGLHRPRSQVISVNRGKLKKVAATLPEKVRKLTDYELFELGKNAQYTVKSMLQTVFDAAMNFTSIEVVAGLKKDSPSADTIRGHLDWKVSLDGVENMMKTDVKRLATSVMRKFNRAIFDIAVDWTSEMYYGRKGNSSVNGTKPQAGSCYAYEFFTVSIVTEGFRFLLFAYPLYGRENLLYYVNRAKIFLHKLGIRIHNLYLDRGFRSVDNIAFLQDEKIRFIMPAPHDCKFERLVEPEQKLPAVFWGWQMQNAAKETVQVNLVVTAEFVEGDGGRLVRRLCGFFTNIPADEWRDKPEKIAEWYGMRWGIETAHRCEDEFRIKSTSVSGIVRYLYFVIGMLVYDLWVYLNLLFCEDIDGFKITVKKDFIRLLCSMQFARFLI